ncbi:MAG: hypothetical protein JST30_15180 [Armatimonadetes bacterium]|nr:hypothetical protein [Armatimonadota bacterium]
MLNLIPALILLLVNGPVAPLSDNGLLGTSVSVQRQAGPDAQTALLRLAFSRLASRDESERPPIAPDSGQDDRDASKPSRSVSQTAKGFLSPGRTRDGPL